AIWNNDINQAIIGRIIQKDPLNNAIVVQHWCHYIDNTDISPSKAAPIVQQCPGCEINVTRYNQIRPYRNQTSRYTCTTKYYASGAVLFPRALKKGNNFVLTVSLFELKQMAKERFLKIFVHLTLFLVHLLMTRLMIQLSALSPTNQFGLN